ncbi:MAG: DUF2752 domain-containing protein [Ferruginibacter sp.]
MASWLQNNQLACPVKKYAHIPCPGCGFQRSLAALFQGKFLESLHLHPALIPILLLLLFTCLHIIFKFKQGPKIIVNGYIFIAILIVCNYIYTLTL